jgi:hypothetical protein
MKKLLVLTFLIVVSFGLAFATDNVTASADQKACFTGNYETVIGYNYQEMLDGIAKNGNFLKVYQNGSRTTLVFAAQDMAPLERMMA